MSSTLRITGGRLRGRRVPVPAGVRPTGARLREALFDIWRPRIEGSRFLDLFAGSGAVGIEALSRGAATAVLVERDPSALAGLERSRRRLGLESSCTVVKLDLPGGLGAAAARRLGRFDLVFADPPYAFLDHERLLVGALPLLAAGGRLAVEHSGRGELPARCGSLEVIDRRSYGDQALTFYRPAASASRAAAQRPRK